MSNNSIEELLREIKTELLHDDDYFNSSLSVVEKKKNEAERDLRTPSSSFALSIQCSSNVVGCLQFEPTPADDGISLCAVSSVKLEKYDEAPSSPTSTDSIRLTANNSVASQTEIIQRSAACTVASFVEKIAEDPLRDIKSEIIVLASDDEEDGNAWKISATSKNGERDRQSIFSWLSMSKPQTIVVRCGQDVKDPSVSNIKDNQLYLVGRGHSSTPRSNKFGANSLFGSVDVDPLGVPTVTCDVCNETFPGGDWMLKRHYAFTHPYKVSDELRLWHEKSLDPTITCDFCGEVFKSRSALLNHKRRKHTYSSFLPVLESIKPYSKTKKKIKSVKKPPIVKTDSKKVKMKKVSMRKQTCKVVSGTNQINGATSADASINRAVEDLEAVQSLRSQNEVDPLGVPTITCDVCNETFPGGDWMLKRHYALTHPHKVSAELRRWHEKGLDPSIRCDNCGMAFTNRSRLWLHSSRKISCLLKNHWQIIAKK